MTIDNARFRKPVVPGDRVEFHVVKQKQRGNIWKFHCDAMVDGALVAEADIGAMMVRKDRRMSRLQPAPAFIRSPSSKTARSSVRTSTIGPFCHVGPNVVLGGRLSNCCSHVVVIGRTDDRQGLPGSFRWP